MQLPRVAQPSDVSHFRKEGQSQKRSYPANTSYGCSFSCLSSMPTNFSMRRCRVSGFLALCILKRTAYRLWLSSDSKKALAFGLPFKISSKSFAGAAVLCGSYALSHCPFCFACSIAANPGFCIRPSRTSLSALDRLIFDQMLLDPLGMNLCSHDSSS